MTGVVEQLPLTADRRGPSPLDRCVGWVRTHPGLTVLLVAPFVVFALPSLFGGAFLDGDNFLQNFPLRALVGRDLAHGILPLWNPYLFSGTPLLGGFNAGAAYPTTWLMAILPLSAAWAINLAVAYDVALAGTYLFLRRQALSPSASTFGAATFAFAGYMSAQIVHIDLVAGAAWLPWMLLAVHRLTEAEPLDPATDGARPAPRSRWHPGWVALLAVSTGLLTLSGGVEAILDAGLVVLIYFVWRFAASGRFQRARRRALVPSFLPLLAGLVGGLVLGAAQWLPGLAFQAASQRSVTNYNFFSTGSLPWRLVILLASPFALGTNQDQPAYYVGSYNFAEVTSYVGVLALIAACSLLVRRYRTSPEARSFKVWYLVLAVGIVSALGAQTPFGRVLFLVPILKDERLLNRNLLLVDFSLAVLLAWWVHLLLEHRAARGPSPSVPLRRRWRPGGRAELVATCLPLLVVSVVAVLAWVGGTALDRLLGAQFVPPLGTRLAVAGLLTGGVVIAAAATWIVLHEARFSARTLRRLLAVVLAVDLVSFNTMVIRPPVSLSLAQAQGPSATAFTHLVGDGRFLVYDPDQFYGDELRALGQTDLNVFNRLGSGQGYAALTDGTYYDLTGAHYQEDFAPASLAGSVWDDLNVTTLLTLPGYFLNRAPSASGQPAVQFPVVPNLYNGSPAARTGPVTLVPGGTHLWYFGGPQTVTAWSVAVTSGASTGLRVGFVAASGRVSWLPPGSVRTSGSTLSGAGPPAAGAVGLAVENRGGGRAVVGIPTAETAQAGAVVLDGPLQFGVDGSHWVYAGTFGSFGVFKNTAARGWAWASAPGGGAPTRGTSVRAGAPDQGGGQQVVVRASGPVTLDRSVTWGTGWGASFAPVGGGPARAAAVVRAGLVQQVRLPAGDYVVTFSYSPATTWVGLGLSVFGLAVLAVAGVVWLARARRRRADAERASRGAQEGGSNPIAAALRS